MLAVVDVFSVLDGVGNSSRQVLRVACPAPGAWSSRLVCCLSLCGCVSDLQGEIRVDGMCRVFPVISMK